MPSEDNGYRNSIMAMGLIFSLFNVTLPGHEPFGIPQYVQCILHELETLLHLKLIIIFYYIFDPLGTQETDETDCKLYTE